MMSQKQFKWVEWHTSHEKYLQNKHTSEVLQARPNQPQHGSLSVSRMGKEGSAGFHVQVEYIKRWKSQGKNLTKPLIK